MNIPSRPSETTNPHSNVAPLSTPGPERDAEAQHEELAARARGLFESSYIPPSDCDNWKSHEHMLDCGNQRIRAKRLFLEQHPEFAAITEIDLQ